MTDAEPMPLEPQITRQKPTANADHLLSSSLSGDVVVSVPRVLIVDDHPENLLTLEAVLEGEVLETVRASSGPEALRCLLDEPDFALILLDVRMPGMDGLEAAALVKNRERSNHIPIIFLTNYDDHEEVRLRGYGVGAVDYLTKPFNPQVLRSKVRVFTELYRKNAQLRHQAELLQHSARELRVAHARAELLAQLGETLQQPRGPRDAAAAVVEALAPTLQASAMFFLRPKGRVLAFEVAWGKLDAPTQALLAGPGVPLDTPSVSGAVLASGQAIYLDDYSVHPNALGSVVLAAAFEPVRFPDGTVAGVLSICREPDLGQWLEGERDLIRRAAATLGLALERTELQTRLETHMTLAVEAAGIGTWDWNPHTDLVRISPEEERLFGIEAGSFGGRWADLLECIHSEDRSRVRKVVTQLLKNGGTYEDEFRVASPDGSTRWLVARGRAHVDAGGHVERVTGVHLDITERRRVEERLREINAAQRRFVSDAAHELRAPMTSIRGNLELLGRYPHIAPEERQEMLGDAAREASRLARLVTDLLALARGDARLQTDHVPVQLEELVAQTARAARLLSAQHTVDIHDLTAATVHGDPDGLKQLALVLVDNALKYTPPGGTVGLTLTQDGGWAELRVVDNGPGIDAADLERVFERFYRVDQARTPRSDPGGTGLGLPIAKLIAEAHGGSVWLESTVGVGTTAVLRLPITDERRPDPQ